MRILVALALAAIFMFAAKSVSASFFPRDYKGHNVADTTKKDTAKFTEYKSLPLKPARKISFSTQEGSWMSLDVSPDGQNIVFDLMGDLYTMPMTGGRATPLTKGLLPMMYIHDTARMAKKFFFISDRSGGDNVWYFDLEKKDTVQLTKDNNQNFPSACWTPDGEYVVYAKGRLSIKLYMVHRKGGGGIQLTEGSFSLKTIDPAVSADGRYVYYSQRYGPWNYNAQLPQYEIGKYDRETGKTSVITSRYGSGFTPVLSKDGKWLVYGSRFEDKTGLVIRDLKTGEEKWLAYPVQRDEQESIAPWVYYLPCHLRRIVKRWWLLMAVSFTVFQSTVIQ